jgi:hypothetical protein
MIFNGNKKKVKFRRIHMEEIIFHKKICGKGDILFLLNITNLLPESLKSVLISRIPSFL